MTFMISCDNLFLISSFTLENPSKPTNVKQSLHLSFQCNPNRKVSSVTSTTVQLQNQPNNQSRGIYQVKQQYGLMSTPLSPTATGMSILGFKQVEQTLTATTPTELQLQPKCGQFTQQPIQYPAQSAFTNLFKRQLSEPLPKRKPVEIIEASKDSQAHFTFKDTQKFLDSGLPVKRRTTLPALDLPIPVGQPLDFKLSHKTTPTTPKDYFNLENAENHQNKQKPTCKKDSNPASLNFKDEDSNSHTSLDFTNNSIHTGDNKKIFNTNQCKQSMSHTLPSNNVLHANESLNNLIESDPLRSFSMSSSPDVSSNEDNDDDEDETQTVTKIEENNENLNKTSPTSLVPTSAFSVDNTGPTCSNPNSTISSKIGNSINNTKSSSSKRKEKSKPKRIRTSFKIHQLIAMKELYESDKNPDSSKLKVLSKKIDLPKRVLQVWFQNSRAKNRKGHSLFSDNVEKLLLQSSDTSKGIVGGSDVIPDVGERNEKASDDSDASDHPSFNNTELSAPDDPSVTADEMKASADEKS